MTSRSQISLIAPIIALLIGICPARAGAQQPPRDVRSAVKLGSGVLGGIVVTDETPSRPLRRVNIGILGTDEAQVRLTMTDDSGRFVMPALAAGRYLVTASKPPYVDAVYGARLPGRPGTAIMLKEGERRTDLTIKMIAGGAITGVITDEYGKPAVGAGVDLVRPQRRGGDSMLAGAMSMLSTMLLPRQITDDRGVYRFSGIPPGEYVVSAVPIDPAGGSVMQTEQDVEAAIRQLGEPARASPSTSSRTPTSTVVGPADRPARPVTMMGGMPFGMRFPDPPNLQVPPGSPNGPTVGYAPVYYPGTTSAAEAFTIKIGPGEDRREINIVARPVPTTRIEGHVFRPDGDPAPNVMIQVRGEDRIDSPAAFFALMTTPSTSRSDGSFVVTGIAPGHYTLYARRVSGPGRIPGVSEAQAAADPPLWAAAEITADGRPITGLDLTLQTGMTISGRVVFDGTREPPKDFQGVNITARPVRLVDVLQLVNGAGRVAPEGTFTISGLTPGWYRLSGAMSGDNVPILWSESSVVIDGRDVTDLPFEVRPGEDSANIVMTLTDRQQQLTGTLQDTSGRPATEYTMILFPADRKFRLPDSRRIQIARPASDGRFSFGGPLGPPPGEYLLAAVTDLRAEEQFDPIFLEALANEAIKVTLGPGETRTQDVRIVRR